MLGRVKTIARGLARPYRQLIWSQRVLPDFIIVGAQKAGTTSLYAYLSQHPQLVPSSKKEPHFFSGGLDPEVDKYKNGLAWYRSHFPPKGALSAGQKTFEASPLYLFNPLAPGRIGEHIPHVKLIAVLRNPTERAISHYFHEKRKGREPLPIGKALRAEEGRLEPILQREDYKNDVFIHHSYKSRGLYREQLERYLEHFRWEQLLVINSDELFTRPSCVLKRVFDFLEVDASFRVADLSPSNVGTNKNSVGSEVYRYLNDFFRPHNQALYDLLGTSYTW